MAGVAAANAAAALGGLPTPRRLGPTLWALPCGGRAPSCCAGSCACRLPAGDRFCARLPCAERGCDRLPCVDSACARLPCRLTPPPCCAACGNQPDPWRSPSAMPCTWCHALNLAVQKQACRSTVTVQPFEVRDGLVRTCMPDMSTPSSSCMLRIGWEPMPSGWCRPTSMPKEPLPCRVTDERQGQERTTTSVKDTSSCGHDCRVSSMQPDTEDIPIGPWRPCQQSGGGHGPDAARQRDEGR